MQVKKISPTRYEVWHNGEFVQWYASKDKADKRLAKVKGPSLRSTPASKSTAGRQIVAYGDFDHGIIVPFYAGELAGPQKRRGGLAYDYSPNGAAEKRAGDAIADWAWSSPKLDWIDKPKSKAELRRGINIFTTLWHTGRKPGKYKGKPLYNSDEWHLD